MRKYYGSLQYCRYRICDIHVTDIDNIERSDLTVTIECTNSGRRNTVRTKSVTLADGGFPAWPLVQPQGSFQNVFHSSQTLNRLNALNLAPEGDHVFHIVGSGQSSADTLAYLAGAFPNAKIVMSYRSYAMRPEDDSHFVNELFMPDGVDTVFNVSGEWREKILKDYWHVTHNGVTLDLLPKLYEMVYYDRANGENRFTFNRFTEIVDACETGKGAVATMKNITDGTITDVFADVTILATGYDRPCEHPLLEGLSDYLETDSTAQIYTMNRDYSVKMRQPCGFNVFLQGYAEKSHGFSEALLSLMPERAATIADEITTLELSAAGMVA